MLQGMGGAALAAGLPAALWARRRDHAAVKALIERYVAEGKVAGAVVGYVTPGAFRPVYLTAGKTAFDGEAVTPDTIHRVYSMTKPVTGMAVMQQVALGRLTLDTPVSDILPAYKDMQVAVDPAKSLESVPAKAPILVRHLLTHTAGLTYHIMGNGPLQQAYRRAGLMPGVGRLGAQPGDGAQPNLTGFVEALAKLPLRSEPGKEWHYSVALDLAGGVLEKVTGKTLDAVFAEQLLGPCGMPDTGFRLSAAQGRRLSTNYYRIGEKLVPIDSAAKSEWTSEPLILAGGAGLASSTRDYARFGQMLLNEGEIDGRRVMPRETARLAMSNLMPAGVFFEKSQGFGAGGRVTLPGNPEGDPAGSYGWGGAAGTIFAVDRARGFAVVLMVQYMPSEQYPLNKEFREAVKADWV
ncbi:serine hydrolase domain-containing protein [Sandaracinobacteroides saxicola]|uniref:Beta-lactamase family protein n=1 Tax=Sandaracinobacteroides saxicola TaxID=2759707 RepID=A0A7G5IIW5_9SPHN|nr:serine hydrolase domain-containing protein [Sandaracinobacteroides saxicola]QMW23307.1 beta-lactamase family protein [Sandaracinobacteroides saxicola]